MNVHAATYYVDSTNGNNPIASASGYVLASVDTSVTKTGAFANYVFHSGDQLQVTAGAGAVVGFYTIASKVSNDKITLTSSAGDSANATLAVGNDGTTATVVAGTLHGPKKNVSSALLNLSADGDIIQLADGTYTEATYLNINRAYSFTIQGNASDKRAVTIQGTSGQAYVIRAYTTLAGKTLTLKNLSVINVDGTTQNNLVLNTVPAGNDPSLVADNVYFMVGNRADNVTGNYGIYGETSSATNKRSITVTNSTFEGEPGSFGIFFDIGNNLTVSNNTFNSGDGIVIQTVGTTTINNNTFTGTSIGVQTGSTANFNGSVYIYGNSFTSSRNAIYFRFSTNYIEIYDNTFTPSSNGIYSISVGSDTATYTAGRQIESAYIHDNTVDIGAYNLHAILLGSGVIAGRVEKNIVTTTSQNQGDTLNIGIVVKSENAIIAYNSIKGVRGLLLKGAGSASVYNNTFEGTAIAPLDNSDDTDLSASSTLKNNIFLGDAYSLFFSNSFPAYYTFDYNHYDVGRSGLVYDYNGGDSTTYANLDAVKAYWTDPANNATFDYTGNDVHSSEGDVTFPTAYNLLETSSLVDAGTITPITTSTSTDIVGNPIYGTPDIGAYEFQPIYDITKDKIQYSGNIRIYRDGLYRYTSATTSSSLANLSITPSEGSFSAYPASTTRPEWLNIFISNWGTTKTWIASSSVATTTIFSVGDLTPDAFYIVSYKHDEDATTTLETQQASAEGILTFTYDGGYSTVIFDVAPDSSAPTPGTLSFSDITQTSLVASSSNATDTIALAVLPFNYRNVTTGVSSGATSSSWLITNLTQGTSYSIEVGVQNSRGNWATSTPETVTTLSNGGAVTFIYHHRRKSQLNSTTTLATAPNFATSTSTTTQPISFRFSRYLRYGLTHPDVKKLQQYLNEHGFIVSVKGSGSLGYETTYFGPATLKALKKFQKSNNLPATGYFGPMTMEKVNK